MDVLFGFADQDHVRRERAKARELRQTQWWRNRLGEGVCYHCEKRFEKSDLTMDHVVPLARGGRTTKNNVVVSCKPCNQERGYLMPVELVNIEAPSDENLEEAIDNQK